MRFLVLFGLVFGTVALAPALDAAHSPVCSGAVATQCTHAHGYMYTTHCTYFTGGAMHVDKPSGGYGGGDPINPCIHVL